MNKEEISQMVAEILKGMGQEPMVKGSDYKPTQPVRDMQTNHRYEAGDFVPDISQLDLRKLYQVEKPKDKEGFLKLKMQTPARLGTGRAGARYNTVSMLRFRADHAAAQDSVFSVLPEDYGEQNGLVAVKTRCESREEYITRPDLGRTFDEATTEKIRKELPKNPKVQLVIGDGISCDAIRANGIVCAKSLEKALKNQGITLGKGLYVEFCRVGAGDAVGDITGCEVVCVLVGERPGLVTNESMSAYITYKPHKGIAESTRTVVSNIHSQGTTAEEAGQKIAQIIEKILVHKCSGVALQNV